MIREVTVGKGPICASILAALPNWFGIPESNEAYQRDVETMPMFVAREAGQDIGFIAIKSHTRFASEIHVLAVLPQWHRKGVGRALVGRARDFCIGKANRFLTVKTRSPSRPDPGYLKTLAFYEALGFMAIEEFPLLWNPENPALMM